MLLTVDIGTSVFKFSIWDFNGRQIFFCSTPLSICLSDGLKHETDCMQWLNAFNDCIKRADVSLTEIEAVVISGNGPSLTPVFGDPVLNAAGLSITASPVRLWLDRRAVKAAEKVSLLHGNYVDAGFFLPKALDIMINEPQLYEKTKHFLGCPELLAFALTCEARTVFPSDGFDRWYWNDLILDQLGLNKEKFPPFIRPGEAFGGISGQAAVYFGLRQGIPVFSGGPDFFAAILGAGVIKPGQACNRTGTSDGINICTEQCITVNKFMSYGHPVMPHWNLSGIVSTTGKSIEWGRNILQINSYNDFFMLADTAQAGSGGLIFLPYLAGERGQAWNSSAKGLLHGLNLSTGGAEIARSLLEGICYALRDLIEAMEDAGAVIDELRLAGSVSGNELLNQIKADILKKPIYVPGHKEAELIGLAIIGLCALGKYSSFAEAASNLVHIERTFMPNGSNAVFYDSMFEKYRRIHILESEFSFKE